MGAISRSAAVGALVLATLAALLAALAAAGQLLAQDWARGRTPEASPSSVQADPTAGLGALISDVLRRGPQRQDPFSGLTAHRAEFATTLGAAERGETVQAPEGFRLVPVGPRGCTVLAEDGSGPLTGQGVYAVCPGTARPGLLVEAPHPRTDRHTEEIAATWFTAWHAKALLVSGADRSAGAGSADAARSAITAFDLAHRTLVSPGDVVIQIHGFAQKAHPRLTTEIVISSGDPAGSSLARELSLQLAAAGVTSCVFGASGCSELGAEDNRQGDWSRMTGAQFLHLELSDRIRTEPARWEAVGAVLDSVLSHGWAADTSPSAGSPSPAEVTPTSPQR